jgi:hypothetical protein
MSISGYSFRRTLSGWDQTTSADRPPESGIGFGIETRDEHASIRTQHAGKKNAIVCDFPASRRGFQERTVDR